MPIRRRRPLLPMADLAAQIAAHQAAQQAIAPNGAILDNAPVGGLTPTTSTTAPASTSPLWGFPDTGSAGPTATSTPTATPQRSLPMGPPSPPSTAPVAAPAPQRAAPPATAAWDRATSHGDSGVPTLSSQGAALTPAPQGQRGDAANLGDIFAEPAPDTNDPNVLAQFSADRLRKIGQLYGLSDDTINGKINEAQDQLAQALKAKGLTIFDLPSDTGRRLMLSAYQGVGTSMIQQQDQGAYGGDAMNDRTANSTTANIDALQPNTGGGSNPFAKYGVYSPEQIAMLQTAMGQYMNQGQAAWEKQTGQKMDPGAARAYMAQAQAMPAINALQNEAKMAAQLRAQEEQNQNLQLQYQLMQWEMGHPGSLPQDNSGNIDWSSAIAGVTGQGG